VWNKEESVLLFKTVSKKSGKYDEHQRLLAALKSKMYNEAKEAIIEKWLTYCKNRYVDQVMQWRL
jgi:DNA-binding GntR family transcriptional regulator